jgi:hypothetical protein
MKMRNAAVLVSAIFAAILLSFSVPVFAGDSGGSSAAISCPPGFIHTAKGCRQRDMVEMDPVGTQVPVSPLCDQDSDCPNGMVCQSCNSARDFFTDVQCPPDKSFCSSAKQ